MKRLIIGVCLLLHVLLFACGQEQGRINEPQLEEMGVILLRLTYPHKDRAAKPLVVDRMTVFVYQGETKVVDQDLTRSGDRGQTSITVPVGTYDVTVASFESDAINMMGSTVVEVMAGTSTTASIAMQSMVPSNFAGTSISDQSVRLSWNAVAGAEGYELQEDSSFDFSTPEVIDSGTAVAVNRDVSTGDSFYRVRSTCKFGMSRWSEIAHVSVGGTTGSIEIDVPWDTSLDAEEGVALRVVGEPRVLRGTNYESLGWTEYSDMGQDARITGEIENTGGSDAVDVKITVSLRDTAGALLGRITNHVIGTVRAGGSVFFEVFIEDVFPQMDDIGTPKAEVVIE